jgi:hypothetical protein
MEVKNAFLQGDLYGAAPVIYVGSIFGMLTKDVSLWPQEGPKGMVCQYGLLLVVIEHCTL